MSVFRQFLCTSVVCYLCMSMGVTFTWPSSTLALFGNATTPLHRAMSGPELALFGSLSSVGALVATPAAGFLLDTIGRKYCAVFFSMTHVVCWALVAASNRVEVILTAMFVSGIGGAAFLVGPVYVSEFCQESIRGGMVSGSMIFYAVGMIVSYTIGGLMDYYPMVYFCLSMAVVGVVLMGLLRESPLFLMMKGNEEEARASLAFFRDVRSDSKEVFHEIERMRRTLNPDLDSPETPEELQLKPPAPEVEKRSTMQFIRQSYATRRALVIVLILITVSIFQGLVVVQVYAEPLFSAATPDMSATLSSVILSVIAVVVGLASAYLMDKAGRKPLIVYPSLCAGASCLLLGSQLQLQWLPPAATALLIYLFCVLYTLGAGSVPYILSSEVFLPEIKSFAAMLISEWAWLCNFVILFVFNPLVTALGLGVVFYLFAAICFLTAVFAQLFLPETKGLPLDEIQTLFSKRRRGACVE